MLTDFQGSWSPRVYMGREREPAIYSSPRVYIEGRGRGLCHGFPIVAGDSKIGEEDMKHVKIPNMRYNSAQIYGPILGPKW